MVFGWVFPAAWHKTFQDSTTVRHALLWRVANVSLDTGAGRIKSDVMGAMTLLRCSIKPLAAIGKASGCPVRWEALRLKG